MVDHPVATDDPSTPDHTTTTVTTSEEVSQEHAHMTYSQTPTEKEIQKAHHDLQRIHANSGHPGNRVLASRLQQDGAPKWIVKLALEVKCDL